MFGVFAAYEQCTQSIDGRLIPAAVNLAYCCLTSDSTVPLILYEIFHIVYVHVVSWSKL